MWYFYANVLFSPSTGSFYVYKILLLCINKMTYFRSNLAMSTHCYTCPVTVSRKEKIPTPMVSILYFLKLIFTARIRRMGKVLFLQVCVCPHWGTLFLDSFPGLWSQVLSGGYPSSSWTGLGHLLDQDWGSPPPPHPPWDRTEERALAMRWAVCLLRSCRRTSCYEHEYKYRYLIKLFQKFQMTTVKVVQRKEN